VEVAPGAGRLTAGAGDVGAIGDGGGDIDGDGDIDGVPAPVVGGVPTGRPGLTVGDHEEVWGATIGGRAIGASGPGDAVAGRVGVDVGTDGVVDSGVVDRGAAGGDGGGAGTDWGGAGTDWGGADRSGADRGGAGGGDGGRVKAGAG
jgi:hypothetical protein